MHHSFICTFIALIGAFLIACEESIPPPSFPDPMVRIFDMYLSPPLEPNMSGTQTSGTEMAGETMAGAMSGGTEVPIAGTMVGGQTPQGGDSEAGMMINAGTEPPMGGAPSDTGLNCLGILECVGNCSNDVCTEQCIALGSAEGIVALDSLVSCDLSQNCQAEVDCLSRDCAAELARCESGGGLSTGGTEMGGTEMGGTEMGGTEMGGSEPPPEGPLNCTEIINCFETCASNDEVCAEACVSAGTVSAVVALASVIACNDRNNCMDSRCLTLNCTQELDDCSRDGQASMMNDCVLDSDCDNLFTCENRMCVECVYSYDCDLGYTCEQNTCVELDTECDDDLYEPNNSQSTATSSVLTGLITSDEELTLCGLDMDFYTVLVCPEGTVTSVVTFDDGIVDIDTEFIFPGSIVYEQVSSGVGNTESMSHTNLSTADQIILLKVYPYDPISSSTYTLDLSFDCP